MHVCSNLLQFCSNLAMTVHQFQITARDYYTRVFPLGGVMWERRGSVRAAIAGGSAALKDLSLSL